MSVVRSQVRRGSYYDSIVLMQLQAALLALPGVEDAGVVMATAANLELLADSGLRPERLEAAAEDLVVVVKAAAEPAAKEALSRVDELLARRASEADADYRPRRLESALRLLPQARWVLVSVPGRYAAAVAEQALELERHVFLFSDNVSLADEAALKERARTQGLLVMGPDCGSAVVNGVGFGFANRIQRGGVGLVAASGTGLQAVTSRLHAAGAGVSHAIGTGGRDLSSEVGGVTAQQGLELLGRDPETRVIILLSKPPPPEVARRLLAVARGVGKPTVVYFMGWPPPAPRLGSVRFATSLAQAAAVAAELERGPVAEGSRETGPIDGYLRGLFAGGTLAHEALLTLRLVVENLHSNLRLEGVVPLTEALRSQGHTILDLGADELTVGRLHPMMDNRLRLERLHQEAADPEVGLIMLDVVLGEGAHADPARDLAAAIAEAQKRRQLEVVALVVGTDLDPQGLDEQVGRLQAAGARVFTDSGQAVSYVAERLVPGPTTPAVPVALDDLKAPVAAVNVGLEAFYRSLLDQGAQAVQVDWRPPAGGDEKLAAILEKMRG